MQFIYGTGVDAFFARADSLAALHGPGFALTAKLRDAVRSHQPAW
jgi:3-hydroxyacyl-CoA dehydrogenase/enoyl-CoA hydratase/3-hydroxybutyryl-CoA epimerase